MLSSHLEQIAVSDVLVNLMIDVIKDAEAFNGSRNVTRLNYGGKYSSRGSNYPECMGIFRASRRPCVVYRGNISKINIMETAPVVARALGLTAPGGWDRRIPVGVFSRWRMLLGSQTKEWQCPG